MKMTLNKTILFTLTILTFSAAQGQEACQHHANDEATYDQLFPTYIEACAGTQEKPKDMGFGGPAGHSFFYIRGACRDLTSHYPRLKICDASDKNQGVGVSVDQVYDNVNWVATEDRDMFFRGGLKECDPLSQEALAKTIQNALDRHIFQNIKINQTFKAAFEKVNPSLAKLNDEQWLAKEGIGTDYAINFHRNIMCARVPMPIRRIQKTVDYLNQLNEKYQQPGAHYNWTIFYDNCTHVVHNALAAAGVFDFSYTNVNPVRQLFNLAIPGNEFVHDEYVATDKPLDFVSIYKNPRALKNLMEGWSPTQAGGTVDYINIHDYKNDVAYTDSTITVIGIPKVGITDYRLHEYLSKPFYTDLRTNLLAYQATYQTIMDKTDKVPNLSGLALGNGGVVPQGPKLQAAVNAYVLYIQTQLDEINDKLNKLP